MKEFNTLQELKTAIEKWFKDLGFDNPERAEKQYLKIISEIGETADSICKENRNNTLSEIGDVFVTVVGYNLQKNNYLDLDYYDYDGENLLEPVDYLDDILLSILERDFNESLLDLNWLAFTQDSNLLQCATIAYNKIEQRRLNGQLKVINGTIQK